MNRATVIVFGSAALYLIESVAFLVHPFAFSPTLTGITYPAGAKLAAYCSGNACLYGAISVSSLYTVQAVSFLAIALLLAVASRKSKGPDVDPTVRALCSIIIAGVAVDYLLGNFAFDPVWLIPNSVAHSPLGLFRYAVFFWIASVAVLLVSNIISPEEVRNGRSR